MRKRPTLAIVWDDRALTYQSDLTLKVCFGVTQALLNTIQVLRAVNVQQADQIIPGILALKSAIDAQDRGEAQTEPVVFSYSQTTDRGIFEAVLVYGIYRESRRRGTWSFVAGRKDQLEAILWKVFRRVQTPEVPDSR